MLSSGLIITVTVCCFCCKLTKRRNERRMDPDAAERRDARRRANKQVQRAHAAERGRSEQPQQQGAGEPSRPRRPLSASNWMSPVPGEERSRSRSRSRETETETETDRERSRREQQQQVQQEQQQPSQPEPSDIEVMEYASGVLGIDPIADAELLYLSREGLVAPLPPAWRAIEDSEAGEIYFYHERTGRVTWEHPSDKHHRKLAKAALAEKYGSSPRSVNSGSNSGSSSEGTDSDSDLEHIEVGPLSPAEPRKPRPSLPRGTLPAPPPRPRVGAVTPNRAPVPFRRPGAVHVIGATGFLARAAGMALSPRDFRYSPGGEVGGRRSASPLDAGEPWLSPRHRQPSGSARFAAGAQAATPATEENDSRGRGGAADKSAKLEEV